MILAVICEEDLEKQHQSRFNSVSVVLHKQATTFRDIGDGSRARGFDIKNKAG